jgi:hypothetical protein
MPLVSFMHDYVSELKETIDAVNAAGKEEGKKEDRGSKITPMLKVMECKLEAMLAYSEQRPLVDEAEVKARLDAEAATAKSVRHDIMQTMALLQLVQTRLALTTSLADDIAGALAVKVQTSLDAMQAAIVSKIG